MLLLISMAESILNHEQCSMLVVSSRQTEVLVSRHFVRVVKQPLRSFIGMIATEYPNHVTRYDPIEKYSCRNRFLSCL